MITEVSKNGLLSTAIIPRNLSHDHDITLAEYEGFEVVLVGTNNLFKFTKFVYQIYAENFPKRGGQAPTLEEFEEMQKADRTFANHTLFLTFQSNGNIIAAARLTQRNDDLYQLPTEYHYGFDLNQFIANNKLKSSNCWHAGRTAIDKKRCSKYGNSVKQANLELLMSWSIHLIQQYSPNPYYIHECEMYLIRILQRIYGWHTYVIGEGKMDLGTVSYPLYTPNSSLARHLQKHSLRLDAHANAL
ncbi:MAG: hypothetical protein MK212_13860 [Saprospiraceae bacterium]|nr:hypothetical protein [Saprospiraceae bacterium]